jgi:hypothetical protein
MDAVAHGCFDDTHMQVIGQGETSGFVDVSYPWSVGWTKEGWGL